MTRKHPPEQSTQDYARIILDAMYQFLGLLDADGTVLEINKAALAGAGVCLADVVGKPFWETHWWAVSEENRALVRNMVQQAAQGDFIRCDIEVYGDSQGQKKIFVDFSLTPIFNDVGKVIFLLPEGRNITEKVAMEAELTLELHNSSQSLQKSLTALGQSELRWEGLYQNTTVGIALADEAGRILKANPALQKMLGYDATEIVGISFVDISEAPLRDVTQANIHHIFDGSITNYSSEKKYQHKNGQWLWANVSVSLIPPVGTEGPRLAVLVEDISARKEAEITLAAAQADLAQVSRYATMGELVATIAHEVNQPLAAIATNSRAALRWLSRAEPDYQEVVDALNRVNRDANLASDVIARIRKFISKGESSTSQVDLRIILQDLQALLQAMLSEAGVSLNIQIEPSLPDVEADSIQLQQVLFNLIVNAIDAMREQGYGVRVVTVTATYQQPEGILIKIRDSGPGIADHVKDRMFDVFFSTKKHGLGMGLAISRTIVERHGGRLWLGNTGAADNKAEAAGTQGACFVFNLPVAR